ncbi:MAG: hypothetical protein E7613_01040 [Ruminococcaceae bacterium]|nr:hypothetical protein [Oscillospiraceae bacterium]
MNDSVSVDKITELLNSPDLMKNVQSILGQLTENEKSSTELVSLNNVTSNESSQIAEVLSSNGVLTAISSFLSKNKSERIALLSALRPFLSSEKQKILDSVLQILKVANIFLVTNAIK